MTPDLEDLRGQSLRWDYRRGYPLEVVITEEGRDVGRLWKPTNLRPEILGRLAGIEWRMAEDRRQKRVGFSDLSFLARDRRFDPLRSG